MSLANLLICMIYDEEGKRQEAMVQYRKVLDMTEYENSYKDAKKYLQIPYTRK
jgi:hypothetical protein